MTPNEGKNVVPLIQNAKKDVTQNISLQDVSMRQLKKYITTYPHMEP